MTVTPGSGSQENGATFSYNMGPHQVKLKPTCAHEVTLEYICPECKSHHVRSVPCGDRFEINCPECAAEYRRKVRRKYDRALKHYTPVHRLKLVTLTLQKNTRGKTNQFIDLSKLFHHARKILVRRGYSINAFVWALEPPNHIHAVMDSDYIPQSELSEIWEDLTDKKSFIVDIRAIDNPGRAAAYITAYITKMSTWTPEAIRALDAWRPKPGGGQMRGGIHVIGSWGLSVSSTNKYRPSYCESCFQEWKRYEKIVNTNWENADPPYSRWALKRIRWYPDELRQWCENTYINAFGDRMEYEGTPMSHRRALDPMARLHERLSWLKTPPSQ